MTGDLNTFLLAQPTVSAIVGTRGYGISAPQTAILPHYVITRLDDDPAPTLGGTSGLSFADVDIDAKAATAGQAEALDKAISAVLKDYTGAAGDITIKAVLYEGSSDGYVNPEHGTGVEKFITSGSYNIQYIPA